MITGIVVALPEELSTLTSKKLARGSSCFITKNVLVIYSGTGPTNARRSAEYLITQGATKLISWGCAAGLIVSLRPGDLILASHLLEVKDGKNIEFTISSNWHIHTKKLFSNFIKVNSGSLVESKHIVSTSDEKNKIHLNTKAVALDMESIAIAKVANKYRLPYLAIRVIADPAEMNLPLAISHSVNHEGEVSLSKLLVYLARHPTELPGLIRLGLHFKAAKTTLKLVAKHLDTIAVFEEMQ